MVRTAGHQPPLQGGEEVAMPIRQLPNDPSFEHLRKEAKQLRKAVATGDAAALVRIREFHPKSDAALADFSLSAAQLVTARTYGFTSWATLKQHLAAIEPFVWNPPKAPPDPDALMDVFIRLACLFYGGWDRNNPVKARRLLGQHPELATMSISAAAAAGHVDAVRDMLEENPSLLNKKAGPLGWEPLLYACYSRMDGLVPPYSTVEVARLLLALGADPNAGFLWGATYVYTALTGAFGEGEDNKNELPHPQRDALAALLLDAGADPNDGQTLYNRHFRENDDHLKLLLSYGLGQDKGGPWFKRLGERVQSPARLLVEELWAAAKNNFLERVKLLVGQGVDVNTPGLRDGRTPYQMALRQGHQSVADYLLQHGARKIELDRMERFAIACIEGRRDEALALLAQDPTLLEQLGPYGRVELIHRAVETNSVDGIRFITELGVDVNSMAPGTGYDRAPLHNAAGFGGRLEIVQLLIALGADPQLRDLTFRAKPIGWAAYGEQWHVVDYLLSFGTIFEAVQFDGVERISALLQQDLSLVNATDDDGDPIVFYLRPGLRRLAEMVAVLRGHGVDLNARRPNGETLLDVALNRREDDFAAALRSYGARTAREVESALQKGPEASD